MSIELVLVRILTSETISEQEEKEVKKQLRNSKYEVGLLLNFGKEAQYKRKAFSNKYKNHKSITAE